MNINLILRVVTFSLLIVWRVYWDVNTKKAEIKKPKTDRSKRIIEVILYNDAAIYILINLFALAIFPFHNLFLQIIGFIFVLFGFIEAVVARKTLNDNWTQSYEYQIKKSHELISNGIYSYVRHPIYGGLIFMVTGVLLVSGSYTFIVGLVAMLIAAEIFAQREEKLLTKHFGKKYSEYMKTSKKFIPFVY
jgi:protein-S-isoprenylcysteine O-methyltransferase Ste14